LFATVAIGVAGDESTGVVFEFMCRIAGAARLGCVPHTLAADVSKVTDGVEENIGGALTFYRATAAASQASQEH